MTLDELIARLESLDGPDREIDKEIWLACVPGTTRKQWSYTHKVSGKECFVDETRKDHALFVVPYYTASIDAALTLVPKGCHAIIDTSGATVQIIEWDGRGWDEIARCGLGISPPIALCIAALRAMRATEEQDD